MLSHRKGNPIQPDLLAAFPAAVAGRYLVHEVVGVGGMATVLRATRLQDGLVVAIKVLDPRLQQVVGRDRFHREIGILSRLQHPVILPLLESGSDGEFLFFVMPFVAGPTLRQRLESEPQLPIEEAIGITVAVLEALEYAHGQNVVHRDIKPENILIEDGHPRVADFGIARAIVVSGGDSISSTGIVIGTPAYMSPEQAAGELRLDARSDVYSTGCLLYEMLAGSPPFSGSTAQAIQARHIHERPPPLRVVRSTIPPALESSIGKALAKVPGDRYPSAADFSRALTDSLTAAANRPVRKYITRTLIAAGLLAAVATAALLLRPPQVAVDPERYLVLPFRQHGALNSSTALSGGDYARLVWQTLSRKWSDLRLVDEALVEDRIRQTGDSALTLSRGIALARSLGAGLVVWGEVEQLGDSVHLQASLYRVERVLRNALQRAAAVLPAGVSEGRDPSAGDLVNRLGELARGLVLPSLAGSADPGTLVATSSFQALRATLSGDSALVNWNLDLAREKYREASAIDPQYAAPHLHFAQASLWANAPVSEWRPAAEAALAVPSALSFLERLEAEAIVALGSGEFPRACERFGAILARDSLRFAGWFGLGECLMTDSVVVPDPGSPSRWRFRGSYAAGIAAYIRALSLVPLAHVAYGRQAAVARLADKLLAESYRLRIGVAAGDSSRRFAAYAGLQGDSITTVPWPIEEVLAGRRIPPTSRQALEASRNKLRELTAEWLSRYPGSPPALEAHARALELAGDITATNPNASALGLVRRLRGLPSAPSRRVELGVWEVRLFLKARRFTAAGLLADSILAIPPVNDRETLLHVGLAALTGRVSLSAQLAELSPETSYILPTGARFEVSKQIGGASQRLLVYVASGLPAESIQTAAARVERLVQRGVEPSRQRSVREAVLFQPSLLAFPLLSPPAGRLKINQIEGAIARHDSVAARRGFVALAAAEGRVSAPAPDHVLLEARLLLQIGDSSAARARLETLLDDLPGLREDLFELVTQAAALPRAMALYGALGGDARGRGLDSALAALWKSADVPLRARVRK